MPKELVRDLKEIKSYGNPNVCEWPTSLVFSLANYAVGKDDVYSAVTNYLLRFALMGKKIVHQFYLLGQGE